jgi:hypothetical protein
VTSIVIVGILCLILSPSWLAIAWMLTKLEDQPNVGPGRIGSAEYKAGAERNDRNQQRTAALVRKSRRYVCPVLAIVGIALIAVGWSALAG